MREVDFPGLRVTLWDSEEMSLLRAVCRRPSDCRLRIMHRGMFLLVFNPQVPKPYFLHFFSNPPFLL